MCKAVDWNGHEALRSVYRLYCFDNLVFATCKRGNFYRGVGYGETIAEAICNMTFYRV